MNKFALEEMPGPQLMEKEGFVQRIKDRDPDMFLLSPSGCNDLGACSMKYKYSRIDKLPSLQALPLVYGNQLHDALEILMAGKRTGKEVSWEEIQQTPIETGYKTGKYAPFKEVWYSNLGDTWSGDNPTQKMLDRELERIGASVFSFKETIYNRLDPVFEECYLVSPVPDAPGLFMNGYIDLGAIFNDKFYLLDYKSAARMPTKDRNTGEYEVKGDYKNQLITYAAMMHNWKLPPEGQDCGLIYISKSARPEVIDIPLNIKQIDVDTLAMRMKRFHEIIKQDLFMPNRNYGLCSPKFCSFWDTCVGEFG